MKSGHWEKSGEWAWEWDLRGSGFGVDLGQILVLVKVRCRSGERWIRRMEVSIRIMEKRIDECVKRSKVGE